MIARSDPGNTVRAYGSMPWTMGGTHDAATRNSDPAHPVGGPPARRDRLQGGHDRARGRLRVAAALLPAVPADDGRAAERASPLDGGQRVFLIGCTRAEVIRRRITCFVS